MLFFLSALTTQIKSRSLSRSMSYGIKSPWLLLSTENVRFSRCVSSSIWIVLKNPAARRLTFSGFRSPFRSRNSLVIGREGYETGPDVRLALAPRTQRANGEISRAMSTAANFVIFLRLCAKQSDSNNLSDGGANASSCVDLVGPNIFDHSTDAALESPPSGIFRHDLNGIQVFEKLCHKPAFGGVLI